VLRVLEYPLDDARRGELRAIVNAYVDVGKRDGWPPERIIASVKRTARFAGLDVTIRVSRSGPQFELMTTDPRLVEIVGWCIDRYYNTAE